ncbi:hypothetical protein ACOSQ2_016492 [Xanthoceras sorbifolium]
MKEQKLLSVGSIEEGEATTFYFFFLPLIAVPLHPCSPTPQQPRSHSPSSFAQPLLPCAPAPSLCSPARLLPCASAPVPLHPCAQPHLAHLHSPSPSLAQPPLNILK